MGRTWDDDWVVCGVSTSRASRAALRWALLEAQRRDTRLLAVRVWPGGGARARARSARGLVDTVRAAVRETGVRGRTWVVLVDGDPRQVLAELGDTAALLVLGAHRAAARTAAA